MKSTPAILMLFITGLFFMLPHLATAQQKPLSVMTYNIRYDNPDDAPNNWDNRKERVLNFIRFYEPTFMGNQEALYHQVTYVDENLPHYEWIGKGRTDGKKEGEFSPLFYDTRKVELVAGSDSTMWLSKTPGKPSKSWDAALPRIVTWGEFEVKSTGAHVLVFNTHFDHIGETARAESARLILETIDKVAAGKPVILTGDFNVTPQSKPYNVLTNDRSGLRDAFHASNLPHVGPLFTFEGFEVKGGDEGRRIDYIFVNEHIQVLKHAVLPSFRGGFYGSDHLPVFAKLRLK